MSKKIQPRLELKSFRPSPVVLSNEHSRAIYDIFGKKGLEVEGWEVFTPANFYFRLSGEALLLQYMF